MTAEGFVSPPLWVQDAGMNRERFAQEVLALCIYADLVPSEEVKKKKKKEQDI